MWVKFTKIENLIKCRCKLPASLLNSSLFDFYSENALFDKIRNWEYSPS